MDENIKNSLFKEELAMVEEYSNKKEDTDIDLHLEIIMDESLSWVAETLEINNLSRVLALKGFVRKQYASFFLPSLVFSLLYLHQV